MFNDITELKDNEARLRENARQLSEMNTFKDKMFTVIAHDIRDPIALLVSLTELLGEELAAVEAEHADCSYRSKDKYKACTISSRICSTSIATRKGINR